jgi:hypothetical protein
MVCYYLHIYDVIPLSAHKIGLFSPREARDGYECSISGHYHVRKLGIGVKAFFELSLLISAGGNFMLSMVLLMAPQTVCMILEQDAVDIPCRSAVSDW